MLDLNKKENWKAIDKNTEEYETNDIRFVRPVNDESIPVDCPECSSLFRNIEDIETYKKYKMCSDCAQDNYYKLNFKWKVW